MRKQSADQVAEAARRRLALLGEELARSGFPPGQATPDEHDEHDEEPSAAEIAEPAVIAAPGRHTRSRPVPWSGRGVARVRDRLPAIL